MFARWGVPEIVQSDNGPQFSSVSFKTFAGDYDFLHTTNPHYPQENGAAERAVQTAKRLLKQKDPFVALMGYRSTPLETTGVSPAQLFLGRNIRTRVPVVKLQLIPKWPDLAKVAARDAAMKQRSATNYNNQHGARLLLKLMPGTEIQMCNPSDGKWSSEPATVEKQLSGRSYLVHNR